MILRQIEEPEIQSIRPRPQGGRRVAVAGLAAAGVLGGATWLLPLRSDDSLSRVRASKLLRVGYSIEPPYAWLTPEATVQGEAAVVVGAVAQALGVGLQWELARFDSLLSELADARYDMVAAGLFVTPQRQRLARFSRPTLRVRPGWLTAAGNPRRLASYASVRGRSDVRIAVLAGSFEQGLLQELGLPPEALTVVPDAQSGLAVVSRGAADGLALSWPSVLHLAAAEGARLQAVAADGEGAVVNRVALAFHLDAAALQQAVDGVLSSYIGSQAHLAALRPLHLGVADLPDQIDVRG